MTGTSRGGAPQRVAARWIRDRRVVPVMLAVVTLAACGVADNRGVELGHLRDLARRVEGGGVECPLAIPPVDIRPPGVEPDAPIVPLRHGGPGSEGTIGGDDLPTGNSVRIMCRWSVQDRAVTLVVVGVDRGHAAATFLPELETRGDAGEVASFLDVNARLPVGRAASLPGDPPAAFSRVQAARGDVALVVTVDGDEQAVALPDGKAMRKRAVALARVLGD